MKKSIWTRVIPVMTVLALIVVTACKQPTAGSVPVSVFADTTASVRQGAGAVFFVFLEFSFESFSIG